MLNVWLCAMLTPKFWSKELPKLKKALEKNQLLPAISENYLKIKILMQ